MPGAHKEHSPTEILLHYIKCRRHNEARLIIKENFANSHNSRGKILHYAVYYNNEVIVRNLIALGTDVDFIGENGMTPLMIAVKLGHFQTVMVLLEADANIDMKNAYYGKSALQMVFDLDYDKWQIIEAFFLRVKIDTSTIEELVERVLKAGCTLHHVVLVKNMEVLESLLKWGMDINSCNRNGRTALHTASQRNDVNLVKWLIDHGAEVNALDEDREGPLYEAIRHGNVEVVQFLLEQGANSNSSNELTPLLVAVIRGNCDDRYDKCVELLLQHGTVPPISGSDCLQFFKFVFTHASTRQMHCLIACLAMLDIMGSNLDMKSILYYSGPKIFKVKKYFNLCQQQLKVIIFQDLSLIGLLNTADCKMKLYVRNEMFISAIENFCREHELERLYAYYYNTLMKRIDEANRAVNLENESISVICRIFDENNNEGYIAAKKVVSYLNESEIQMMARV